MEKLFFLILVFTVLIWFACNTNKQQTQSVTQTQEPTMAEKSTTDDQFDKRLHDIWVLTNLNGEELTQETPCPQLELSPDEGRISGKGCCNQLFGQMTANKKEINFTGVGTTKMHCGEWMEREGAFLKELARAERYTINKKGELFLFWGDLATLVFRRK